MSSELERVKSRSTGKDLFQFTWLTLDLPALLSRLTSLSNQIICFSFWEKLSRCDCAFESKPLKLFSSIAFLKGIWSEETGLGAENRLKSQFPKYPVFLWRVRNWNLPAAGRRFQRHLWLQHSSFPKKHLNFSLSKNVLWVYLSQTDDICWEARSQMLPKLLSLPPGGL